MGKLLVVGSLNMDTVVSVSHIPKEGETILGSLSSLSPGGKGANQAYAAGKLGAQVGMVGCVGEDKHGEALLNNLKSVQVDTKGILVCPDSITGNAFITVDQAGENSIVVIPGANSEISKEWIDRNIELIDQCDALIAQLEIPLDVVAYAAFRARERNKRVILDPAPAPGPLSDELLKYVDIIKPNETELQILTGMSTESIPEIEEAARELLKKGVKQVVVTIGSKGSLLVTPDGQELFPPRKVDAVDTTAAGDSFTAAFCMKLVEGVSCQEAIRFANAVSSIVVTRKGAQSSIPSYAEAMEVYRDWK